MRTLTAVEKWSYAIGNIPFAVKDAAFVNFVVFYYTQVHGLSGTMAGLAMFIAVSWDAVTDPVVGSWSDTVRTRWGRRHPLLVAGGPPTAVLFIALFSPPGSLGEWGLFTWLLGSSILLRTFLTIYFIPYSAMGAELSVDYDERTVIAKARVTMGWLAGMALPALAFTLVFRSMDEMDGRLIQSNYSDYGLLSALLAGIAVIICVWGTRTVIDRLPEAEENAPAFTLARSLADFRLALGNRNFRISIGSKLAFGMCAGLYSTLGLYLGTYFWEFSTEQLAGLVIPTAVATLLAFSVLSRLGQRFDKVTMLGAASLGLAVNALWFIGARLLGLLPDNGHPVIYLLQWLNTGIGVFVIVSLQVISVSFLADVLDEHELATGRRQEGVFFAAGTFIGKATTGLGALLAGAVIDIAGLKPGSAPGSIEAPVLQTLGLFASILIFSLAVLAFFFIRRLRLSREDHRQVREQLAAKVIN